MNKEQNIRFYRGDIPLFNFSSQEMFPNTDSP